MGIKSVGTQTDWQGLVKCDVVRPDMLLPSSPPPDTPTPPHDDMMLTEKPQFFHAVPEIRRDPPVQPEPIERPPQTSSLLQRRAASLNPHIALPTVSRPVDELNDEVPLSPPTTRALLSPLPEANRRHAGHTPLIDRALSPAEEAAQPTLPIAEELEVQPPADDRVATPDLDEALTGALTLPANPVDGAEDHIELSALDKVLGKIAKQQAVLRGEFDDEDEPSPKAESSSGVNEPSSHAESSSAAIDSSPQAESSTAAASKARRKSSADYFISDSLEMTDEGLKLSRKGSADTTRSGATEEIDGIRLKAPSSNFGAPMGQL